MPIYIVRAPAAQVFPSGIGLECSVIGVGCCRWFDAVCVSVAGEHTYKCLSCAFSTTTISQLKEHSLQEHGETLTLPKLKAGAGRSSTRPSAEHSDENTPLDPDCTESLAYLEPADVQQQLSHFQQASRVQADGSPPPPPPLPPLPPLPDAPAAPARPDSILTCEFCEFSSGYMQSLRRHYRDRHGGKKLFKCKDCCFFTCYKSTFTLHVEGGHSSGSEELLKDLRCPFCLYHSKHKTSMIDHIVLHREERVAPLEVSRSKLSRHLEGLVFRCHKCTFTCSSEQNLQMHIQKHEELKPYQCQLCYYDSKLLHELEIHLREEHKVIRNYELVGRVNLDQLELMKDKMKDANSSEEEEREEEEADEEEEEEMMDEEEEEKLPDGTEDTGAPESPVKRYPCEFCGRTFTLSIEWERHVLRHGMTVNDSKKDASPVPSSAQPLIGPAAVIDRGIDQPTNTVDAAGADQSDQSESPIQNQEEEGH
ncbi:zinc finger protein 462 [Rhinichthys klamathensis goyatoka]|uniref:zinc finger protein 462 n=1 Tax=Rhinichthys klamathensis goyatoka TaxID=3034132 RepID=UPI0024B4FB4F|nr:zinc finger protein 462 [Rhinichthys klamathensis goyatoka]